MNRLKFSSLNLQTVKTGAVHLFLQAASKRIIHYLVEKSQATAC